MFNLKKRILPIAMVSLLSVYLSNAHLKVENRSLSQKESLVSSIKKGENREFMVSKSLKEISFFSTNGVKDIKKIVNRGIYKIIKNLINRFFSEFFRFFGF